MASKWILALCIGLLLPTVMCRKAKAKRNAKSYQERGNWYEMNRQPSWGQEKSAIQDDPNFVAQTRGPGEFGSRLSTVSDWQLGSQTNDGYLQGSPASQSYGPLDSQSTKNFEEGTRQDIGTTQEYGQDNQNDNGYSSQTPVGFGQEAVTDIDSFGQSIDQNNGGDRLNGIPITDAYDQSRSQNNRGYEQSFGTITRNYASGGNGRNSRKNEVGIPGEFKNSRQQDSVGGNIGEGYSKTGRPGFGRYGQRKGSHFRLRGQNGEQDTIQNADQRNVRDGQNNGISRPEIYPGSSDYRGKGADVANNEQNGNQNTVDQNSENDITMSSYGQVGGVGISNYGNLDVHTIEKQNSVPRQEINEYVLSSPWQTSIPIEENLGGRDINPLNVNLIPSSQQTENNADGLDSGNANQLSSQDSLATSNILNQPGNWEAASSQMYGVSDSYALNGVKVGIIQPEISLSSSFQASGVWEPIIIPGSPSGFRNQFTGPGSPPYDSNAKQSEQIESRMYNNFGGGSYGSKSSQGNSYELPGRNNQNRPNIGTENNRGGRNGLGGSQGGNGGVKTPQRGAGGEGREEVFVSKPNQDGVNYPSAEGQNGRQNRYDSQNGQEVAVRKEAIDQPNQSNNNYKPQGRQNGDNQRYGPQNGQTPLNDRNGNEAGMQSIPFGQVPLNGGNGDGEGIQSIPFGQNSQNGGQNNEITMSPSPFGQYSKNRGQDNAIKMSPSPFGQAPQNNGYGPQSGQTPQNNGYGPQSGQTPQNNGHGPQSGQTPQNNGHGPQSGQTPQNNGHGPQSGQTPQNGRFEPQRGQAPQNSGFGPQNVGYGQQSGQAPQGNMFGPQSGKAPQNKGFRSLNGQPPQNSGYGPQNGHGSQNGGYDQKSTDGPQRAQAPQNGQSSQNGGYGQSPQNNRLGPQSGQAPQNNGFGLQNEQSPQNNGHGSQGGRDSQTNGYSPQDRQVSQDNRFGPQSVQAPQNDGFEPQSGQAPQNEFRQQNRQAPHNVGYGSQSGQGSQNGGFGPQDGQAPINDGYGSQSIQGAQNGQLEPQNGQGYMNGGNRARMPPSPFGQIPQNDVQGNGLGMQPGPFRPTPQTREQGNGIGTPPDSLGQYPLGDNGEMPSRQFGQAPLNGGQGNEVGMLPEPTAPNFSPERPGQDGGRPIHRRPDQIPISPDISRQPQPFGRPGQTSGAPSYGRPGQTSGAPSYGRPGQTGSTPSYGTPGKAIGISSSFGQGQAPGSQGFGAPGGVPAGPNLGRPGQTPDGLAQGSPGQAPYGTQTPGVNGDPSDQAPGSGVRPQGNFKGGDGGDTLDNDPSEWGLEDSIPGTPGEDYPNLDTIPDTGFDCKQHPNPGYYGDVNAQCQVFHICQADGRSNSFLCPVGTIFNQQYFICDWWFNFNCAETPDYYNLNANLYSGPENGNFKGDPYPDSGITQQTLGDGGPENFPQNTGNGGFGPNSPLPNGAMGDVGDLEQGTGVTPSMPPSRNQGSYGSTGAPGDSRTTAPGIGGQGKQYGGSGIKGRNYNGNNAQNGGYDQNRDRNTQGNGWARPPQQPQQTPQRGKQLRPRDQGNGWNNGAKQPASNRGETPGQGGTAQPPNENTNQGWTPAADPSNTKSPNRPQNGRQYNTADPQGRNTAQDAGLNNMNDNRRGGKGGGGWNNGGHNDNSYHSSRWQSGGSSAVSSAANAYFEQNHNWSLNAPN